jgi:hypothetical protein
VHDLQVRSLGPEIKGVPATEFHRAGQPCVACHQPSGPAKTTFTLAGTVFQKPGSFVGIEDVQIFLLDADGKMQHSVKTNCVGNFWLSADDPDPAHQWDPTFPVKVAIGKTGFGMITMNTYIDREASCNQCHADPQGGDSPGHIYLVDANNANPPAPATNCNVDPTAPQLGTLQ